MVDFIFMLTRHDQTILDCLETVELIRGLGIRHIGFKDIGVERATIARLNRSIHALGATSYMEMVSTTGEAILGAARLAREVGVDRLLGGTAVDEVLAVLAGSAVAYYPFAGRPEGHPTRLGGNAAAVAADCRRFAARGCAGVDLLAYRAYEAQPLDLIRAARAATPGHLIVAGSIDSPARIRALAAAGADAFTIGSAVFDGSFSLRKGSTFGQLKDVLAACG
ncbi:MAG: hypothetical protein FJX56_07795 [Alphaproteobacteria bacterium]|nr:hypothetical protein [Alphaproteobacteria bacterium]